MRKLGEMATMRRERGTRPRASAFVVTVIEGRDAGTKLRVAEGSRILVGQSPACTLQLTDREVSRRHASLAVQGDALVAIDLGSTNGTTVNGVSIKEVALHGGEAMRLGQTVLGIAREEIAATPLGPSLGFGRVAGESLAMRHVFARLEDLSKSDAPALFEGETGTGKNLMAEELHALGARASGPFVVHASDDADPDFAARLAEAKGGTLYVTEIAALDALGQALLVKHLEAGPTGGDADVRVVAATRRDLDRDITDGRFDEKLFALLAAGRVDVPPLREREDDVALLAEEAWKKLGKGELPADFLVRFDGYNWPGNVRELEEAVAARFANGAEAPLLKREDVSKDYIDNVLFRDLPFSHAKAVVFAEFERRYLERVLEQSGGNVRKAAKASGVAHRYFQLMRARSRGH